MRQKSAITSRNDPKASAKVLSKHQLGPIHVCMVVVPRVLKGSLRDLQKPMLHSDPNSNGLIIGISFGYLEILHCPMVQFTRKFKLDSWHANLGMLSAIDSSHETLCVFRSIEHDSECCISKECIKQRSYLEHERWITVWIQMNLQ